MTDEKFNKGFKLLMRFLKEEKRYQDFKNITVAYFQHKGYSYKKYLKREFVVTNYGWRQFFNYTAFVGENWREYNDPGLSHLRIGWHKFIENEYTA
jgi:hypothetical protein